MKVLVVGSGGREHVLVWKLKQSARVKEIFCAPGNGGIAKDAQCVDIASDDVQGLCDFAVKNKIGLTIVGPEGPLVKGIVDEFQRKNLKIFGPSQKAAQLEGSKVFAKEFMRRHNIPTADFESFDNINKAKAYVERKKFPIVIKADGLAAGKGVVICKDLQEAHAALDKMMSEKIFNTAGENVVIEECLEGEEASILAVSDGEKFVVLESSQDHKRIFDGDMGANTGGMGAYSPAPVVTKGLMMNITEDIIEPTIHGMRQEGMPFTGVLYVGVMATKEGPKVLEYNVRFGDPETQVVLPRLKTDLVDLCLASCKGKLAGMQLEWSSRPCVCVVMSARGYPGSYEKGKTIYGLDDASKEKDVFVFHAGTKNQENKIVTSGGRVLGVTGLGKDIEKAIENAYNGIEKISFDGCFFRRDIGAKALRRLR
ncbi:MAG: phosphoribosylamine--glycine ligase [Candidatus Omnitrophica bacterium]|nr:phosphoribosylamine--glycine ligase [Candidatus Omnitrophota bacterium]